MDDTRLSILSYRSPPSQKEDDSALVFIASYNSREREKNLVLIAKLYVLQITIHKYRNASFENEYTIVVTARFRSDSERGQSYFLSFCHYEQPHEKKSHVPTRDLFFQKVTARNVVVVDINRSR